jgi:hypothetical protein
VSGPATLSGPVSPGSGRAAQAGRAWLTATPVGAARQAIVFGQPEGTSAGNPATMVGASVTLQATASSGLSVSFRSDTPLVCTVSSTIVTAVAAGVCTVTASQPGNAGFAAAPDVAHAFQIGTGTGQQAIRFPQPEGTQPGRPETMVGAHITLSATVTRKAKAPVKSRAPTSSLAISFRSDTPAVCAVSDATIAAGPSTADSATTVGSATAVGAGACTITATQPGDSGFAAAGAARTFQVGTGQKQQAISFPQPPDAQAGARVPLTARASSGLAVTFRSDTPAVCTVSGGPSVGRTTAGRATAVGPGPCTITATQDGDASFAASDTARTFQVGTGRKPQKISFDQPKPVPVGTPADLSATATSGLAVTFRSDAGPAPDPPPTCTVSGTTVITLAAGSCTITASQGGSEIYQAAPEKTVRLIIFAPGKPGQKINFSQPADAVVGVPVVLSASATSGLAVSFYSAAQQMPVRSRTPPVCTVSGATVITLAAGSCTVTAFQAGSEIYAPAAVTQSFRVRAAQVITFVQPGSALVGVAVPLTATASSGLPVSFRSDTPAVCTLSGTTVTTLAAGACTITATQGGNDDYLPAPDMRQSFRVKATQTINFTQPGRAAPGVRVPLAATASSRLPVSFHTGTPGVCTVSATAARTLATGTCIITATQGGNADYAPAPVVARSFTVYAGTRPQTITFRPPPGTVAGRPIVLFARATSRLPVSFRSDTPAVCTVSGTTVTALAAGMCTITASQGGSAAFKPATDVPRSLEIRAGAQPQLIDFGTPSPTRAGSLVPLIATASSGLPVALRSGSRPVCTVSGTTVTALAAGMCTITATQGGSALYTAAPEVMRSFQVAAGKVAQTITFAQPDAAVTGAAVTLLATATSGLTVSFRADTPACAVSGTTVITVAAGACTITASQGGSARYSAARAIARTFPVRAGRQPQTINFGPPPEALAGVPVTPVASASSGLPVSFRSGSPSVCTVSGTAVTTVTPGTCTITATQGGNTDFAAARNVTQSFPIRAGQNAQTIDFGTPAAGRVGTPVTLTASATSGLPVSFSSATPAVCTVSGTTVSTLAGGTCAITATQGGSATYAAARSVTHSFAVGAGHKSQWITFGKPPDTPVGHPAVLTASASSGLPVSFSSATPAVCTVSGTTVTTLTAGTCTITATQGGSTTYAAARTAPRSFQVNPAAPAIPAALIRSLAAAALAAAGLAAAGGVLALRRRRLRLRGRPPAAAGPSVHAEPHPGPPGSSSTRTTGAAAAHTVRINTQRGATTMMIKESPHGATVASPSRHRP